MKRESFILSAAGICVASVSGRVVGAETMDNMMQGRTARRTVAVLLGAYSVFLDWAGPAETFYSAGFNSASTVDEFRVVTLGKSADAITIQVLGSYTPQFSVRNSPRPDVIVIPGSMPKDLASDSPTVDWVRAALRNGAIVLSVCTGAMVLAEMHLLDGLSITTSHGAYDHLARLAPNSKLIRNQRFVDNGQIVMAAGTTAGIDASLHIVERLIGKHRADEEREYLEYQWEA